MSLWSASPGAVKDHETVGAGEGEQSTHLSYDGRPVNILCQGQCHVVYVHLSGRSPPSNSIAALLTYFDRNSAMQCMFIFPAAPFRPLPYIKFHCDPVNILWQGQCHVVHVRLSGRSPHIGRTSHWLCVKVVDFFRNASFGIRTHDTTRIGP